MERGVKRRHTPTMKTNKKRTKLPVLCAGLIASAATAFAGEQTLPTPPQSGYVDTESSVNVPIADWPRLRRRFTLALAANTSPTGCVQVAFGRDTNGDECLEPEETELVVGNDCGAWFVRDELTGQEDTDPQPPSGGQPSSRTFALVQSKALERRWNMAKVTTRGRADSNASLLAEWQEPFAIFLK